MSVLDDNKITGILEDTFGLSTFRLNQEKIIESLLEGNDTLAIMPTGGGKSLCYQLPALYMDGLAIVVSPLISLMQDQVAGLKQYGIQAEFYNSSLNYNEKDVIVERLKNNDIKLLYVAPERILHPETLELLSTLRISLFAIDEAHCVSQWGHEFRSDYTRLNELKQHFPDVPTIALTATADERTRNDIIKQLDLDTPNIYVSSFDRPNIKYMIFERDNEIKQLDDFIKTQHHLETGIVYCLSRKKVERVAKELKKLGHNSVPYHAGLTPIQRARNQKRFDREAGLIVVATIAFGMGIDRPDVRFVAHLDLPKSIEGYYQETGRAGRDGEASNAWMVYGLADVVKLSRMIETTDADETYKRSSRHKLNQMLSLCEGLSCRRQFLLSYFGETLEQPCGHCDTCLHPVETWDATVEAQKFLSAVYRTGQMFGSNHVIDVLRGSANIKITQRQHDQLSVYGIGKDHSKQAWSNIVRQLMNLNYIHIKDWDYLSIALSPSSKDVLSGNAKVHLRKIREKIKNSRSKKSKSSNDPATAHNNHDLFTELRKLRLELATKNNVPPYIIFSDKSLHDMCSLLPQNKDQMLAVHGVGQKKYETYGEIFINAIQKQQSS